MFHVHRIVKEVALENIGLVKIGVMDQDVRITLDYLKDNDYVNKALDSFPEKVFIL